MIPNHQHTLWINLPLWVTATLTEIWERVPEVRSVTNPDHLAIPLGCYHSPTGIKIYNALRTTKRRLFNTDPQILTDLDNGIAWARGIHCGHHLPALDMNFETASLLMACDSPLLRRLSIFRRIGSENTLEEIITALAEAKSIPNPPQYLKAIIDNLASTAQFIINSK